MTDAAVSDKPIHSHCPAASELVSLYRVGALSPVEVVQAVLARIEECQDSVNAFAVIDAEAAMAAARASEGRWVKDAPVGPLDGVPATVKDLLLTRGWPTRRGSKAVDPAGPWMEDAPVVARLREAGAVLLGKTTTPEFGWKGVTDSPLTGITRNPWDTRRTPGGSSGGAAVAAALGMGPLHVGTDGGGSIRIPAALTGVFGFKPSFGRVPSWPPGMAGTLFHVGPITRTVTDAAMMMTAISRPDSRDWSSLPYDGRDYLDGLDAGIDGLRVAFSPTLGYVDCVTPEVADRVAGAVREFQALGAIVEEVDPGIENPQEIFFTHWSVNAAKFIDSFTTECRAEMEDGFLALAAAGSETRLFDYLEAVAARDRLAEAMRKFHDDYDLLLTPALPVTAFEAGRDCPDGAGRRQLADWAPFSHPFNLTRQPAASVPCGFTSEGLPVGIQIVGPINGDALVLRAARTLERAHPFEMPTMPNEIKGMIADRELTETH